MEKVTVARVGKLFGESDKGGLSISLYTTFPEEFDPTTEPLMVEIDSLDVPLWCDKFERRGVSGANVLFADFDTPRRAEELIGKELFMTFEEEEESDEFFMEDLIGFKVLAGKFNGEIVDYYDSEHNPLFGVDFGEGEHLIPAAEEFIANINFEKQTIKMILPEGLLEL